MPDQIDRITIILLSWLWIVVCPGIDTMGDSRFMIPHFLLKDWDHIISKRADRYQDLLHRFRDLRWTIEVCYLLCKRKRGAVSLGERVRFRDVPVLMDFRRASTTNPEQNCEFHNRTKLRALLKKKVLPWLALLPCITAYAK